eukprot:6194715-Pleurochrysis_carterae.AAC.2
MTSLTARATCAVAWESLPHCGQEELERVPGRRCRGSCTLTLPTQIQGSRAHMCGTAAIGYLARRRTPQP